MVGQIKNEIAANRSDGSTNGRVNKPCWIEETFQKRECVKFQRDRVDKTRCMCGRSEAFHLDKRDKFSRGNPQYSDQWWDVTTHTESSPTDAYGVVEFQGGSYTTKAQYIRLSSDSRPEQILQLLSTQWGLHLPRVLISIHGNSANSSFCLQPQFQKFDNEEHFWTGNGRSSGAWIISGLAKVDGDTGDDSPIEHRPNVVSICIAPWGLVHKREDLIGRNINVPYFAQPGSDNAALTKHHSYFLLVDDGTEGKFGCEMILRKKFENYISQLRTNNHKSTKDNCIPVVCLLMEGNICFVRKVLECVTDKPPIPAVLAVDGRGGAADLLSFACEQVNFDGTMPEISKRKLLSLIAHNFNYEQSETIFSELLLCAMRKNFITFFKLDEEKQDIGRAILYALIKSRKQNPFYHLNLIMTWDRIDVARNYLFNGGVNWPDGSLDNVLMDALIDEKVEFVQLFIEKGINMQTWLTVQKLEDLYNQVLNAPRPVLAKYVHKSSNNEKLDASSTLKHLLAELRGNTPGNRTTLYEIGQVVNKLMGGCFQSTYSRRKFLVLHSAAKSKSRKVSTASRISTISGTSASDDEYKQLLSDTFRYPYSELIVWAVLLRRNDVAMFMWQRGEEPLAKCLVAAKLYKSMAREAEKDEYEVDTALEIRKYHNKFSELATKLLDQCFRTNWKLSQLLLTYELLNWNNQTCLSLAVSGRNRFFLAHTCCQLLLTEMWKGGLRIRKYSSLKVLFGILCFPSILFFKYRSQEELQLMPQQQDVHADDSDGETSSSDSESIENENFMILQTLRQQQQQLHQFSNVVIDSSSILEQQRPTISTVAIAALATAGATNSLTNHAATNEASQIISPFQRQIYRKRRFSKPFRHPAKNSNLRRGSKHSLGKTASPEEIIGRLNEHHKQSQLHAKSKILKFYTAPITKFWMHLIAHLIFLLLYTYMILQTTPADPSTIEWFVVAYMCGLGVEKIRELMTCEVARIGHKILSFLSDVWSIIDILSVGLFFIGFAIRFTPALVSSARAFYCLTVMLSIIKLIEFFVISPRLGPFGPMISQMLKESISIVAFVFVLIWSFGTFRESLWFPDHDFEWTSVREVFLKPYIMLFGEVYKEFIWPDCVANVTSPDDFKCVPGRWLVPAIFSMFMAIGYVVLFNVLIALFNRIYMQCQEHFDIVWKFQRYELVIKHVSKPILPPPFIIISHFISLLLFIRQRCSKKWNRCDRGLKIFLHENDLEKLHCFEKECLEDYQEAKMTSPFRTVVCLSDV
ncbi:hypothetical protein HELRODRAFT_188397 [Helobdella robusta]|uniref:TRPM SLOG domain-containing protein n=1 Tax=Helobdella robusta TaxID=6412 RepID=T1FPY1_HELRO|nr:hypothetical protein HELRODRAFT_188397 [Helobdella robusta]ESO06571.1 hypothetical protein HELRODRAFT_188397 [Helobdella robusta]